jgi:hypothetical protein
LFLHRQQNVLINLFFSLAILLIFPGVAFFYDYNTFALRTWSDWQWALNKPLHSRLRDLLKHIA